MLYDSFQENTQKNKSKKLQNLKEEITYIREELKKIAYLLGKNAAIIKAKESKK